MQKITPHLSFDKQAREAADVFEIIELAEHKMVLGKWPVPRKKARD
jgi:predicted 3-demethylubiquinone-9 3-methyltransferase (glyoxalase superfamily)